MIISKMCLSLLLLQIEFNTLLLAPKLQKHKRACIEKIIEFCQFFKIKQK